MLRTFDGAVARRVIDRSHTDVPEHAHAWPMLSIFILGSYQNETELGRRFVAEPSVVFYRAGVAHRNAIAAHGFEQLEIEFDPAWLGHSWLPEAPIKRWSGGTTPVDCRGLLSLCEGGASGADLRTALRRFLTSDPSAACRPQPWLDAVLRQLRADASLTVRELAKSVDRHPAWLGAAYQKVSGEGLQETAARIRVERAAYLLRETDHPSAGVALEAGFCDQSHMNRSFKRVLGRTPSAVRADRERFRPAATPAGRIA